MKPGLLAIPPLAALVLTQVMVGVARAGDDYKCHGPGYYNSHGGYHKGYRDHGRRHDEYGYRHRYGNQHELGYYGHGNPSTGGREPSRTWKDPTYGTGEVDRSPRSPGTDLARQHRRVYPNQFRIPPGYHPPPGSCRLWYDDRPAGYQPPPGDCGLPDGLVL